MPTQEKRFAPKHYFPQQEKRVQKNGDLPENTSLAVDF
jgi:hypothetical protein